MEFADTPEALLDANVLAGFLVATGRGDGGGTIWHVVRVGLRGAYVPLLPQALVDELLRILTTVPYFVARIGIDDAQAFVAALRTTAEELPDLGTSPLPLRPACG